MSGAMFLLLATCALLSVTCKVQGKFAYEYHPKAGGWFKLHKVALPWTNAVYQCQNEGATLASPINEQVLDGMLSIIGNNNVHISYFIGTHSRFSPGQFVSIEGVPLEYMPVMNRYQMLHPKDGECLTMNGQNISVASCSQNLPYICYRSQEHDTNLTECGTIDKEYKLEPSTGSCYKVHRDLHTWPEAYSLCISEGGYLAIPNDAHEANIIKNMIPDMKLNFTWDQVWDPLYIGIRDWSDNGSFMTIHGEPVKNVYNVWPVKQPDRSGQLCVGLIRSGMLDNVWCNLKSFFVCEKDPQLKRFSIDYIELPTPIFAPKE